MIGIPNPNVVEYDGISVAREDVIPGGTKLRYMLPICERYSSVTYASSAQGGAQLALAFAAYMSQHEAHIFTAARDVWHPRTAEAERLGANIHEVRPGYLTVIQKRARDFAARSGSHLIEFGGESEAALDAIAAAAAICWEQYGPFDEVWSAAGSGVLQRGLQRGMPDATFYAVAVGRALLPEDVGRAKILVSGVPFEKMDSREAPFPSCPNYDRKAWWACSSHTQKYGKGQRVLFWNVMGPSPTGHGP